MRWLNMWKGDELMSAEVWEVGYGWFWGYVGVDQRSIVIGDKTWKDTIWVCREHDLRQDSMEVAK